MAGPFKDPIIDSRKLIPIPPELNSRGAIDPKKAAKYNKLKELNQKLKEAGISPENDAREYKQRDRFRYDREVANDLTIILSREDISIAAKNTQNAAKFKDALSDLFVYMYTEENICALPYQPDNTISYFLGSSTYPEEIAGETLLKLNAIKGKECLKKHSIKFTAEPYYGFINAFEALGLKFETASNQKINAVICNKKIGINLVENEKSKLKLTEILLIRNDDRSITLKAYYGDKKPRLFDWPNWHFKNYILKSPEIQ